jgi:ethanolamine ammonia-lyase small subunit
MALAAAPELALVLADGLSAQAAQAHGVAVLQQLRQALAGAVVLSKVYVATQARVALSDEVGSLVGAQAVLILLGERPGLSSPDSLGAYITFEPRLGRSDAERNCVSNIRPAGLSAAVAAGRIAWLVREALRRRVSGVALKDDSSVPTLIDTNTDTGTGTGTGTGADTNTGTGAPPAVDQPAHSGPAQAAATRRPA